MKVFLAAIEGLREGSKACARVHAPFVLTSYYYTGYVQPKPWPEWLQALRHAKVRFADSGAFTLRTSVLALVSTGGNRNAKSVDYDAFTDGYIKWLAGMKKLGLFDVWAEMDISAVTSYDWVHKQRDKMINAGLGSGLIAVWHSDADWDYWKYLLREAKQPGRSGWVAIEGDQLDRDRLDYNRFLHEAYKAGVKVHGFRMTGLKALKAHPFYSVDSSTWIMGVTRGQVQVAMRDGGMRSAKLGGTRSHSGNSEAVWKGHMPRAGTTKRIRFDAMVASAQAWVTAGEQLDRYWKARGVDWDAAVAAGIETKVR